MGGKSSLFYLIGTILFLMGIFGALRVGINLTLFEKYPTDGVIPANLFLNGNMYMQGYQKEEDCAQSNYYYGADGLLRSPTSDEIKMSLENEDRCIASVGYERNRVKQIDINTSGFLLFVGFGTLLAGFIFGRDKKVS